MGHGVPPGGVYIYLHGSPCPTRHIGGVESYMKEIGGVKVQ